MTLNHVSDQDIVECLQNCPELDGPLLDVNVLEELYLSDELWTNLDIAGDPTAQSLFQADVNSKAGHLGSHGVQKVCDDVTGIVTPPYSPPTPCSSFTSSPSPPSSTSSVASPPACSPPYLLSPAPSLDHPTTTITVITSPPDIQQGPLPSPPSPPQDVPMASPHIASPPKQSSLLTNTQQPSLATTGLAQNLSTLCSQLTLPHFNGSLQVLKSGETVCIPQASLSMATQPQPSLSKTLIKQEHPVVGQKRQRPQDAATTAVPTTDMSNLSKKQQRMMKNRESACISRQKKRQYVDSLEARLKEAATKNSALLQENTSLRKQVTILEKENESLRLTVSRPSSPSSSQSVLKRPALVMMVVLCFSFTTLYWNRSLIHDGHSPMSSITALTHVKSRALLSIDTENSITKYQQNPGIDTIDRHVDRNALVPMREPKPADPTLELEERVRKWKMRGERKTPTQQIPAPVICSCPVGNKTRNNLTNVKLINEEMTSCFKLNSLHSSQDAVKNSLAILSHSTQLPNYLEDGPSKLYQGFKKFVPQDLNNYYLLSFKEHVLLHPPKQNSSHLPFLSVFIPADSDFTSLLQMDCEVTSTKIISHLHG